RPPCPPLFPYTTLFRSHFPGLRPDPLPCYHAMDLFALSSLSEQMPVAVIEAMACALPVLATDVGDVATMVAAPGRPCVVAAGDEDRKSTRLNSSHDQIS